MSWLTKRQLQRLQLRECGRDVQISERCAIHGADRLRIGDHVRIDDWTVITARKEVVIGSHVHIGAQCFISGTFGVTLSDFCGLSPGVAVLSASDDFGGAALTGPTIPDRLRRVRGGRVWLGRHVIVGARSVILPAVRIGDGAAIGSLSLVAKDLSGFAVYAGIPARRLRARSRRLLALETELREDEGSLR